MGRTSQHRIGVAAAPKRKSDRHRAFAVLGVALVIGACLDRATIEVGGFSIYYAHLIALAAAPIVFTQQVRGLSTVVRTCTGMAALAIACTLPSILLLPGAPSRASLLFQFIANCFVLAVAFGCFSLLALDLLKRTVTVLTVFAFAGAILQSLVQPELVYQTASRFLSLPRPSLLFYEPTWFAFAAALLLLAALALRLRLASLLLVTLLIAIFTRGALAVAAAGLLMTIPHFQRSRFAGLAVLIPFYGYTAYFLSDTLRAEEPVASAASTLEARSTDVWLVRELNPGGLLPWGGEVLSGSAVGFWRDLPSGSNVALVEYLWKFGIGGILLFAAWSIAFCFVVPRRQAAALFPGGSSAPILVGVMIVPATLQFNNALGQPWLWVLLGLLIAVAGNMGTIGAPVREAEMAANRKSTARRTVRR